MRNSIDSLRKQEEHLEKYGDLYVGNARLTVPQVVHIKKCLASYYPRRKIADLYNVGVETISRISRGTAWRHVQFTLVEGEDVPLVAVKPDGSLPATMHLVTEKEIDEMGQRLWEEQQRVNAEREVKVPTDARAEEDARLQAQYAGMSEANIRTMKLAGVVPDWFELKASKVTQTNVAQAVAAQRPIPPMEE